MKQKRILDLAARVLDQLSGYDARTSRLMAATGLCCPPGCGTCCESVEVEASVLELLPLAVELWRAGEADPWLDRVLAAPEQGRCVFYDPTRLWFGQGRCRIYPWRPLICRLFGYAAVRDKHGRPRLGTCKFVNELSAAAASGARERVERGEDVVCFADATLEIDGLDPGMGRERLPINRSVALAIERVGLAIQLDPGALEEGAGTRPSGRPRGRRRRPAA